MILVDLLVALTILIAPGVTQDSYADCAYWDGWGEPECAEAEWMANSDLPEDGPLWDCEKMGNHICGPLQ